MSINRLFKVLDRPASKINKFSTDMNIDKAIDEVFEEYGFENRMRLLEQAINENEYLSLSIRDVTK